LRTGFGAVGVRLDFSAIACHRKGFDYTWQALHNTRGQKMSKESDALSASLLECAHELLTAACHIKDAKHAESFLAPAACEAEKALRQRVKVGLAASELAMLIAPVTVFAIARKLDAKPAH
jgi:hypothetical protein